MNNNNDITRTSNNSNNNITPTTPTTATTTRTIIRTTTRTTITTTTTTTTTWRRIRTRTRRTTTTTRIRTRTIAGAKDQRFSSLMAHDQLVCVCQCILRAASGSKFSRTLSSRPVKKKNKNTNKNHHHNHNHKGKRRFYLPPRRIFFPLPLPFTFSSVPFLLFDPSDSQIIGKIQYFGIFLSFYDPGFFFHICFSFFFFISLLWFFPSLLFICPYSRKYLISKFPSKIRLLKWNK